MRTYKRKTARAATTQEQFQRAANDVLHEGMSVRAAAIKYNISRMTLTRFMEKYKSQDHAIMGYTTPRQVFNAEQEEIFKQYLLKSSAICYGLAPKNVRSLAYHCATHFNLKCPDSWKVNKMAGKDWLTAFLKRNQELSIRKPKATSLGRATPFNKSNVSFFFDQLAAVMDKHKFTASCIWNADEIGISTASRPCKIVAAKGKRNVGSLTSAERGTNVTLIVSISAVGNTIPPMFIFPRKKYEDYFISGGPSDCIGTGNASGCVTDDEFYLFMNHFIKHAKASVKSPVLLLLNNHSSHFNIKTLDLAKTNGVVMLSFPPHCSHKLQPLDVSVFGPFKKYLSRAQDDWLRSNPDRTMTIYDIPKIVADSLPLATTGLNIINGFIKTGIFPYNSDVFIDSDFAPSYVTDRPENPTAPITPHQCSSSAGTQIESNIPDDDNTAPNICENPGPSTLFSPEVILSFPKAGPRKQTLKTRKKRKASVLTDTPEKNALAEEQASTRNENAKIRNKTIKWKKDQIKEKMTNFQNSSSEDEDCIVCLEGYADSLPGEEWI